MISIKKMLMAIFLIISLICFASVSYADYFADKITGILTSSGRVLITWENAPNPGACGANGGYAEIPASASKELKALAMALYLSGKSVRIQTIGCTGTKETVTAIYSPKG